MALFEIIGGSVLAVGMAIHKVIKDRRLRMAEESKRAIEYREGYERRLEAVRLAETEPLWRSKRESLFLYFEGLFGIYNHKCITRTLRRELRSLFQSFIVAAGGVACILAIAGEGSPSRTPYPEMAHYCRTARPRLPRGGVAGTGVDVYCLVASITVDVQKA